MIENEALVRLGERQPVTQFEQKYRVFGITQQDLGGYDSVRITQGYIGEELDGEIRVREYNGERHLSSKSGNGLERECRWMDIDDEKFARYWLEYRNQSKGSSLRKLTAELRVKGIDGQIIDQVIGESDRNDESEIEKIIAKKRSRYPDQQKFMQYLARQGFSYDAIKTALNQEQEY